MQLNANFGEINLSWQSIPSVEGVLDISGEESCSFRQLLKILAISQPEISSPAYNRLSEHFVSSSYVSPLLMPKKLLKANLANAEKSLEIVFSSEENASYVQRWLKIIGFLNSMRPAKIDENALRSIIEEKDTENNKSMMSFLPDSSGYAKKVKYNTSDSLTGRIKVISGPQILTAPHEVRNCIRSSYDRGRIMMVDFMSIEPRIALITVGKEAPEDVYSDLLEEFPSLNRKAAKLATLTALYGGKANRLCEIVEDPDIARKSVSFVKSHFRVQELERMLGSQAESGLVRNALGRPLREATKNPRIRTNHYLQSSAAEISVCLFEKLCSEFSRSVKPLYVIHDALIVDLEEEDVEDFQKVAKCMTWKSAKMPVKFEILSPT